MTDSSLFRANVVKQFVVLTHRAFRTQWRDVKYNMARCITFALQSIFFGVVFRDLHRSDFASVQVCESVNWRLCPRCVCCVISCAIRLCRVRLASFV
jgi:hypothetical protein